MKDPPLLIKSRDGLRASYFSSAGVNGFKRNICVDGAQQCLNETAASSSQCLSPKVRRSAREPQWLPPVRLSHASASQ
jgi:hypothetical protein